MEEIILDCVGEKGEKEIKDVSGKKINFRQVKFPTGDDALNVMIRFTLINRITKSTLSDLIHTDIGPYSKDSSFSFLKKSINVPNDCDLKIKLESVTKPNFKGQVIINYDVSFYSQIFISESDRQNAQRVALLNIAKFHNLPNADFEDNDRLIKFIKDVSSPLIPFLQRYFVAYNHWFEFYQKIRQIEISQNRAHDLTDQEKGELGRLIEEREKYLNELQKKFDQLQFEKFKRLNGLENVDGTIDLT